MLPDSMLVRLFGDFLLTSSLRIQPFRELQGVKTNDCIRRLPNSLRRLHSPRNTFLVTDEQHTFPFRLAPRPFSPNCFKTLPEAVQRGIEFG